MRHRTSEFHKPWSFIYIRKSYLRRKINVNLKQEIRVIIQSKQYVILHFLLDVKFQILSGKIIMW
jgi:hypothetical protein